MIIIFHKDAGNDDIQEVVSRLQQLGIQPDISIGEERTIIGAIGDEQMLAGQPLTRFPGVERVLPVLAPYKNIQRSDDSIEKTQIGSATAGGREFIVFAGTPMVESPEQFLMVTQTVAAATGNGVLANLFQPRRSPYAFTGLGAQAIPLLESAADNSGIPVIAGLYETSHVAALAEWADALVVEEEASANLEVIEAAASTGMPLILIRSPHHSAVEFLETAAFAYTKSTGGLILCDSGSGRLTAPGAYNPSRLIDFGELLWIKKETGLPLFIMPNKAVFDPGTLPAHAAAAAAAGLDGMLLFVHPEPHRAMYGGNYAVRGSEISALIAPLNSLREMHLKNKGRC